MPDYLILLSTLGGLAAFGLAGVVIGPIIAAFFLAVWAMAAEEFSHSPPEKPLHNAELPSRAPEEPHRGNPK
jgi:predicted PurR-regulated permease PerM